MIRGRARILRAMRPRATVLFTHQQPVAVQVKTTHDLLCDELVGVKLARDLKAPRSEVIVADVRLQTFFVLFPIAFRLHTQQLLVLHDIFDAIAVLAITPFVLLDKVLIGCIRGCHRRITVSFVFRSCRHRIAVVARVTTIVARSIGFAPWALPEGALLK